MNFITPSLDKASENFVEKLKIDEVETFECVRHCWQESMRLQPPGPISSFNKFSKTIETKVLNSRQPLDGQSTSKPFTTTLNNGSIPSSTNPIALTQAQRFFYDPTANSVTPSLFSLFFMEKNIFWQGIGGVHDHVYLTPSYLPLRF